MKMANKNVELVCMRINEYVTYTRNWTGLNNELLKLGLHDPQILVDYILHANGDPHYNKEA